MSQGLDRWFSPADQDNSLETSLLSDFTGEQGDGADEDAPVFDLVYYQEADWPRGQKGVVVIARNTKTVYGLDASTRCVKMNECQKSRVTLESYANADTPGAVCYMGHLPEQQQAIYQGASITLLGGMELSAYNAHFDNCDIHVDNHVNPQGSVLLVDCVFDNCHIFTQVPKVTFKGCTFQDTQVDVSHTSNQDSGIYMTVVESCAFKSLATNLRFLSPAAVVHFRGKNTSQDSAASFMGFAAGCAISVSREDLTQGTNIFDAGNACVLDSREHLLLHGGGCIQGVMCTAFILGLELYNNNEGGDCRARLPYFFQSSCWCTGSLPCFTKVGYGMQFLLENRRSKVLCIPAAGSSGAMILPPWKVEVSGDRLVMCASARDAEIHLECWGTVFEAVDCAELLVSGLKVCLPTAPGRCVTFCRFRQARFENCKLSLSTEPAVDQEGPSLLLEMVKECQDTHFLQCSMIVPFQAHLPRASINLANLEEVERLLQVVQASRNLRVVLASDNNRGVRVTNCTNFACVQCSPAAAAAAVDVLSPLKRKLQDALSRDVKRRELHSRGD